MSEKKTGGTAFPSTGPVANYGMTLRHYFAAKAMQGMLSDFESSRQIIAAYGAVALPLGSALAGVAYNIADEMIARGAA
jgi:hypothetical protein